jgi:hypothetical protein
MPVMTAAHQLGPPCDVGSSRHSHDWSPAPRTARRCSCGHTQFKVNVGGALPPSVVCKKCANPNRTASAWIEGYFAGVAAQPRKAAL